MEQCSVTKQIKWDWSEVKHQVELGRLTGERRCQIVEEASQHAEEQDLIAFVLPILTEDEMHHVLKTLLARKLWLAVGTMLERNISDTLNTQLFTEVLVFSDETAFSQHILPKCSSGQIDSFVTHLITTGRWEAVRRLVGFLGNKRRAWTIGEKQGNSSLEGLVECLVARDLLSEEDKKRLMKIGRRTTGSQSPDPITILVEAGRGTVVTTLLTTSTIILLLKSDTKAIDVAILSNASEVENSNYLYALLLSSRDKGRLNLFMSHLVTKGLWKCARRLLDAAPGQKWTVGEKQVDKATLELVACLMENNLLGEESERRLVEGVRKYTGEQDEDSIKAVIKADHATVVKAVRALLLNSDRDKLSDSFCDTVKSTMLAEALGLNGGRLFSEHILPVCSKGHLDVFMDHLVSEGLWKCVRKLLEIVGDAKLTWAVGEKQVDSALLELMGTDLLKEENKQRLVEVVRRYSGEQDPDPIKVLIGAGLSSVMTALLASLISLRVGKSSDSNVSDAFNTEILTMVLTFRGGRLFSEHILPNCSKSQVDLFMTHLVTKGLWEFVRKLLEIAGDEKRTWTVGETQVDQLLLELVERLMGCILFSEAEKLQVVEAVRCYTGDQNPDPLKVLIGAGLSTVMTALFLPCLQSGSIASVSENESIFTKALCICDRRMLSNQTVKFTPHAWSEMGKLFGICIDKALKIEILANVMCLCNMHVFSEYMLPNLKGNRLDLLMTSLITADPPIYGSASKLLEFVGHEKKSSWIIRKSKVDSTLLGLVAHLREGYQLSAEQRRKIVEETIQLAQEPVLITCILPVLTEDEFHDVLTTLFTRCLWPAVGSAIARNLSDKITIQILVKSLGVCDKRVLSQYILPKCKSGQLDLFMTHLVSTGEWQSIRRLLDIVGDGKPLWRIGKTKAPADNRVIRLVAEREGWSMDAFCDLSDSQREHVFDFAYECAGDGDIRQCILPQCADSQLDEALFTFVKRGLWRVVSCVLDRVVSPARHRWAVVEACQQAHAWDIEWLILPHCDEDLLGTALKILVSRGLWKTVGKVLEKGVGQEEHRWATGQALRTGSDLFLTWCMLPSAYSVEGDFDYEGLDVWNKFRLQEFSCDTLYRWALDGDDAESDDTVFWRYVINPHYPVRDLCKLMTALRRSREKGGLELSGRLGWDKELCAVLYESFVHFVTETWVSGQHTLSAVGEVCEQARLLSAQMLEQITNREPGRSLQIPRILRSVRKFCCGDARDRDVRNPIFGLCCIRNLVKHCNNTGQNTASFEVIASILACVPVVPDIQSVALTVMLRRKRWDVIRRASLSGVWEQVRRRLLTAAMKQRQWDVVAQWANYTIYDDQCVAALEEAYTHKQWHVYLLLADHGPTELELMRVHYRLARYATWDVVLEMFERGADMIECQEGIRPGKNLRILNQKKDDNERRPRYVKLLLLAEEWEKRMEELQSLEAALELQEWSVALHEINRRHRRHEIVLALKAALMNRVWHVAIYLIRQGIGARLCDKLFSVMLTHQQWDVCRVLLEEGVDPQLALDALPQLIEQNQWTLVARLMEYDLDDALRRRIMKQALDKREGSVVWQCIINMEHDHLSVEERQELFHEAFNRENWQAMKPLVEVKDDTGIQHRDDALLESIEQHQWDVVDHCLLFRANINMLDEDNHTPMHRMARKDDWEAVEELTKRGGDPNSLDKDGMSVFHRVIRARQWELVKMLIEYHGDIHQRSYYYNCLLDSATVEEKRTPLQMLIDARQLELIKHTFMWCPDQWKGVNDTGETTLHVACLTGYTSILYNLVARRVDPRALTVRGHSAMSYAVMCQDRPQQTVAECIYLGFSTHQPPLTDLAMNSNIIQDSDSEDMSDMSECSEIDRQSIDDAQRLLSSPVVLAVMRGLLVVTQMLYESGACSYRELFALHTPLLALAHSKSTEETTLGEEFQETVDKIYKRPNYFRFFQDDSEDTGEEPYSECVALCARYMAGLSATPRSLKSMCRHAISRSLKLHKRHVLDVYQLPLAPSMKHYVMFGDLIHPDCGRYSYSQRQEEFVSRNRVSLLSGDSDNEGSSAKPDTEKGNLDTARPGQGAVHTDDSDSSDESDDFSDNYAYSDIYESDEDTEHPSDEDEGDD